MNPTPTAQQLLLAEMAAIRRLAAIHGVVLSPRAIEDEARDRVALTLGTPTTRTALCPG